jgi:hypothetical protein
MFDLKQSAHFASAHLHIDKFAHQRNVITKFRVAFNKKAV